MKDCFEVGRNCNILASLIHVLLNFIGVDLQRPTFKLFLIELDG